MEYFAFQWHITEACDQRCRHCYIYALGSHAKFQEMALEDMVTMIENCKTFCQKAGRLPYLYITGGDPILHPQFWALMKLLKLSNIPFALMGNPFHLTADVCRRLKDYGCRKYQLSLDGLRETHDGIRQQPGSYDATMAAIPLLQGAGIDVAIMTTVSRWNYRDIPALVDEVVKNKADIFAFARYCPSQEDRDVCCSPEEYRDMMEQCWEKFQKYRAQGCETTFNLKDHLWTLFLYEKGLFDPKAYPEDEYVYEGCNWRQLPSDHPLRRGGVRLPPHGKQGGQRPHRRPVRPVHRAEARPVPGVRKIREVLQVRAAPVLPGMSRRGGRVSR